MRVRDTRAKFSRRFASREKSIFRSDDAMLRVRGSGICMARTSGSCAVNRPRKRAVFPMKRARRDVPATEQVRVRPVHCAGTCRCAAGAFSRAMPACIVREKRHVPVIIARVAFFAPRRVCGIAQVRHRASASLESAREGRFVSTNLDDGSAVSRGHLPDGRFEPYRFTGCARGGGNASPPCSGACGGSARSCSNSAPGAARLACLSRRMRVSRSM